LKEVDMMHVASESSAHINRLKIITAATMDRKSIRQTGKRSWGRKPIAYANEDKPDVASCGSVNNVFGTLALTNIGELASLNWSAKLEGGLNVGVESGFQCLASLPWDKVTSFGTRR
jgi:hypothetical protein